MVTDQSLNNNGWPERYFAVIFTAQRSLSGDDIYDINAQHPTDSQFLDHEAGS